MRIQKTYTLLLFFSLFTATVSAQTLEQARTMFSNGNYAKAAPVFQKYVKSQPANANYNYWYGVCCLRTGKPAESVKYLETAVQKKVTGGRLALGEAYDKLYRFEDAASCYEEYIADLKKKKQATLTAEKLLEKSKLGLRMLKGVEKVTVIDSFVVDKANFLSMYKISEESGRIYSFNEYFESEGEHPGTVYETELANKVYYGDKGKGQKLHIYTQNKLQDEWGKESLLPSNINTGGNTNYPFVLTDGVTIYYASDDANSLGGYDIFVSRYNTSTDSYLAPENVGMPFNSPFNDYMYVVDEFNNLGWFASDRYQAEGEVCVYVFIPNASKQTYNYESMDHKELGILAQLSSLKATWTDKAAVSEAKRRLGEAESHRPTAQKKEDFSFVIDDIHTYHHLSDFRYAPARDLFQRYQQKAKEYQQQAQRLEGMRLQYATTASSAKKEQLAPSILDLEKRVLQMSRELEEDAVKVRNTEKQHLK